MNSESNYGNSSLGSPMKNINFDKETSQIKQITADGTELIYQINIDVFDLKIFALLMCKGSLRSKASYLFDILQGPETARAERKLREAKPK